MPEQKVLFLDIESWGVEHRWNMAPQDFVRLSGYGWDADGPVTITDDLEEIRSAIREADISVAHNGHAFDWSVIFGKDSTEPLELALEDRLFDTWTFATLVHPAPSSYVDRDGRQRFVTGPERAKHWFSLDNQAFQLGVAGKSQDLKGLAAKWGGFEKIPTDDPEFREYLTQDVQTLRAITRRLCTLGDPNDPYAIREQLNAAIDAQNSRNGVLVDQDRARARIVELEEIQRTTLAMLHERYGLPTTGKAPLRTKAGKEAVIRALHAVGITEDMLPRTANGGPSLGGKGLVEVAENLSTSRTVVHGPRTVGSPLGRQETIPGELDGPDRYATHEEPTGADPVRARELANAIAQLGGLRPLAQSALDNVQADGRVHPEIFTLQRSGRKSTQNPGLTVWTSRGAGAVEKSYFVAAPGHVLVELDYSQADARIVAAYSGDKEFAKRFEPGVDAHLMTAWEIWGKDVVGTDKKHPVTADYRQTSKACSHADAYRAGPRTIAATAKVDLGIAQRYKDVTARLYPARAKWQERVTQEAKRYGYVTNQWGRRMVVERDREFTQAPALYGQSGTREIVVDGLIRMARRDIRSIQFLRMQVHDALVFEFPEAEADYWTEFVRECMETTWGPGDGRGQDIHFPVEAGHPARDWAEAGH